MRPSPEAEFLADDFAVGPKSTGVVDAVNSLGGLCGRWIAAGRPRTDPARKEFENWANNFLREVIANEFKPQVLQYSEGTRTDDVASAKILIEVMAIERRRGNREATDVAKFSFLEVIEMARKTSAFSWVFSSVAASQPPGCKDGLTQQKRAQFSAILKTLLCGREFTINSGEKVTLTTRGSQRHKRYIFSSVGAEKIK